MRGGGSAAATSAKRGRTGTAGSDQDALGGETLAKFEAEALAKFEAEALAEAEKSGWECDILLWFCYGVSR